MGRSHVGEPGFVRVTDPHQWCAAVRRNVHNSDYSHYMAVSQGSRASPHFRIEIARCDCVAGCGGALRRMTHDGEPTSYRMFRRPGRSASASFRPPFRMLLPAPGSRCLIQQPLPPWLATLSHRQKRRCFSSHLRPRSPGHKTSL